MTARQEAYAAMQTPDMERRVANMIRKGTVSEVDYSDPKAPRVRVRYGKNTTAWIPWTAARAGRSRTWHPLKVGEQVIIASQSGDLAQGVIIGSIHSNDRPAPASGEGQTVTEWDGGIREELDDENNGYSLTIPAGGMCKITVGGTEFELTASGARLKAPQITFDTPHAHFTGEVTSEGDQIAQTISQLHHLHSGVIPGPANTGEPVP